MSANTEPLYAALPGQAMAVSDSEVLFMPQGRDDRHIMTFDVYSAFERCQSFAPLTQHANSVKEVFPDLSTQNLERVLQNLVQRGLLQSDVQTLEQFARQPAAKLAPLQTMAIVSPGHPAALEAFLASTSDADTARDRSLVLLDASESPELRARKTELMAEFGRKTGQRVVLLDSKRERFLQERLTQMPEHAQGLELLLGKAAHPRVRAHNAMLLSLQGERALVVDDAMRMRAVLSGVAGGAIQPSAQARRASLLANVDSAKSYPRAQSLWDVAGATLGAGIGQMAHSVRLNERSLSELQGYERARAARLGIGLLGSADTDHSLWAFGIDAHQHALLKDREALSAALAGDSVLLGYTQASLAPPLGSAAVGLDLSTPLGFAIGFAHTQERDVDLHRSFAALSSFVDPTAMELCVPVAIERRAAPQARESKNREPLNLSAAQFLAEHVANLQDQCFAQSSEARWRWLAVQCLDLAEASPEQRAELLWRYVTTKRAELLAQLQNYHMQAERPSEVWRHELLAIITAQAEAMIQATNFALLGFSKDLSPADALSEKLRQLASMCVAWAALTEQKHVWR